MSRFIVALLATSLLGVAHADDPRDPSEYGTPTDRGARAQPGPEAQPIPASEDADDLRLAGGDTLRIRYEDAEDKQLIRTSLEDVEGIEIREQADAYEVRFGDPKRRAEVRSALEEIEGVTVRQDATDKTILDVSIETEPAGMRPAATEPTTPTATTPTEPDRMRIRYDNADEKSRIEQALDDMDGVDTTDRGGYLEIDLAADPSLDQRVRDALNDIEGVEVRDRAGFVEIDIGEQGAQLEQDDHLLDKDVDKDVDADMTRVDDERKAETKSVDDDVDLSLEGAHDKPGVKIGEADEPGVKGDVSVDLIGAEMGDVQYANGKYTVTNTYEHGQVKVTHTEKAVRSAGKDVKWGSRDVREDLVNAANDIIDAVEEAGEDVGRELDEAFETDKELEREEEMRKR